MNSQYEGSLEAPRPAHIQCRKSQTPFLSQNLEASAEYVQSQGSLFLCPLPTPPVPVLQSGPVFVHIVLIMFTHSAVHDSAVNGCFVMPQQWAELREQAEEASKGPGEKVLLSQSEEFEFCKAV